MNLNFCHYLKISLFLTGLFLLILPVQAQSTIGGYISYTPDLNNPNKIFVTLTTYSKIGVVEPDLAYARLYWGDGTSSDEFRLKRTVLDKNTHLNIFEFDHVYAAPGNYTVAYAETNRDIAAVNIPDTNNKSLFFSTQIRITPVLGFNSSPVLQTNPVFDVSYINPNQKITVNLSATDPDGDSLTYHLVPALQARIEHVNDKLIPEIIPDYFIPDFATINAKTGELILENMPSIGRYNFVVQISEYRNQALINSTLVDFTSLIGAAEDRLNPTLTISNRAELTIISDTIIFAVPNEPLIIQVQLSDPRATYLELMGSSELFDIVQFKNSQSLTGTISFTPDPFLKRDMPYPVTFTGFASNAFQGESTKLKFYILIQDKLVTGIKDKEEISLINAYPNPAENYIIIEHPYIKTGHTLTVYDLTGKIIRKLPINHAANTKLTRQDISQLGHFFYTISDHIKVKQTGRFIFK